MGDRIRKQCRKGAQDGTTVTFVADTVGEGLPKHLDFTQAVFTFAATPASMFGTSISDGRKYLVTVEEYT
jgi:hypothetical protein